MKSAIICEGSTDLTLIQYFMEKVYKWDYIKEEDRNKWEQINFFRQAQMVKWFKTEDNFLSILSSGGVSKIPKVLNGLIDFNINLTTPFDLFNNIVIISDQDEINTETDFILKLKNVFKDYNICFSNVIKNNEWIELKIINPDGGEIFIQFLLLIIPFEETGALETFLLNSLSENDETDKKVIKQCNNFIEKIDTDNRYLQKRRHITKAKFDTYFSVRTPVEQFGMRRDILKNVNWEDCIKIQNTFEQLQKLS